MDLARTEKIKSQCNKILSMLADKNAVAVELKNELIWLLQQIDEGNFDLPSSTKDLAFPRMVAEE